MTTDAQRAALAEGERIGAGYVLVPPRTMLAGRGGARVGRRAGGSLEFRDHRDYEPGDDLRHLDWSVLARSDRLAVKQFHEEISPFVDLIVDGSRSMMLKERGTLSLAALLATAVRNSGCPYALWLARERLEPLARGAARPTDWQGLAFDHPASPAEAIVRGARSLRPLSVRILISDLLWEGSPEEVTGALATGGSATLLVQVLSTDDAAPDLRGGWRILDVESGEWQEVFVDAEAMERYRQALTRHRAMWDEGARNARATIVRCVAEELESQLVFEELAAAEILKPAWFR
ncbi:MAG TPA: DUF58 domain-containing protein [Thermoanaerobaculia bacterium]